MVRHDYIAVYAGNSPGILCHHCAYRGKVYLWADVVIGPYNGAQNWFTVLRAYGYKIRTTAVIIISIQP